MVNLTGITAGPLETQMLQVTAVSSNTGLIPNPAVAYTSPNATGTLTYKPVADQSGTAIVTVTVKDAGLDGNLGTADDGMVSQSFTVTVTAVNDAPTVKAPAQVSTKQDVDFTFTAGTASEISVNDIDSAQLTVALVLQSDPLTPAVDPGNLMLGTTQGVTITGGTVVQVTIVLQQVEPSAPEGATASRPAAGHRTGSRAGRRRLRGYLVTSMGPSPTRPSGGTAPSASTARRLAPIAAGSYMPTRSVYRPAGASGLIRTWCVSVNTSPVSHVPGGRRQLVGTFSPGGHPSDCPSNPIPSGPTACTKGR